MLFYPRPALYLIQLITLCALIQPHFLSLYVFQSNTQLRPTEDFVFFCVISLRLTDAVAVVVWCEASHALGLCVANKGANFVFAHRASGAVVGLQSAFINVCKERRTR